MKILRTFKVMDIESETVLQTVTCLIYFVVLPGTPAQPYGDDPGSGDEISIIKILKKHFSSFEPVTCDDVLYFWVEDLVEKSPNIFIEAWRAEQEEREDEAADNQRDERLIERARAGGG